MSSPVPPTAEPGSGAVAGLDTAPKPPTGDVAARVDLKGRSLRQHSARGTIINGAFLVGLSGLALLKGFAVAVFLSRADYGAWGIAALTLSTIVSLKRMGVGDRYVQQSEGDQELAFQRAFTVELVFTAAFTLAMVAAVPLVALAYGRPEVIAPGLALALVPPAMVLQAPLWVFYRRMDFVRQRALQAVDPVVALVVTLALAAAGLGYWSLVIGLVAGAWTAALVALRASPYPIRLAYERGVLRRYWTFSWPLFVATGSTLVVAHTTMLLGSRTLGLAGVGAIALAVTISQFAERVDSVVTGTLYPAIAAVRERTELLFESFVKSNRLALIWAMPFGVGLALFASDLVAFGIGERWRPAVGLIQAFGLTAAFGHLGFNWNAYFRALGDTRPVAVVQVVTMLAFLLVGAPLLVAFGLDGLALGIGFMVAVSVVARSFYLRRLFSGFGMVKHALRAMAPTVPATAAVLAVRALEGGERGVALVIVEVGIYGVVTVVATLVFERALLREVAGYLRRRRVAEPAAS